MVKGPSKRSPQSPECHPWMVGREGNSERFWLNLQTTYDIELERDHLAGRLLKEVQVFAKAS